MTTLDYHRFERKGKKNIHTIFTATVIEIESDIPSPNPSNVTPGRTYDCSNIWHGYNIIFRTLCTRKTWFEYVRVVLNVGDALGIRVQHLVPADLSETDTKKGISTFSLVIRRPPNDS